MGSAELSFGVLSSELWSPQGLSLARSAYRKLGRRGLLAFGGAHARERARLARGDVRLGCRAWTARALGAAHRARARAGCLRVHDPGDRLCRAARRHAGAEGRRHPARRGALGDRARGRGPASNGRRCAADPRGRGPRDGCRARWWRARARRSRRDRERHADAALREAARAIARARRRRALGRALPLRPRGHADPPRAQRAARCGPRARASGSRRPSSCTSPPGSTASLAPSTRPTAGCCRPRPRSSSASPAPSIRAVRPRAGGSSGSSCRSCRVTCAATRSARSTSATDAGPRRCATPTPTASSVVWAPRSRTSSVRR